VTAAVDYLARSSRTAITLIHLVSGSDWKRINYCHGTFGRHEYRSLGFDGLDANRGSTGADRPPMPRGTPLDDQVDDVSIPMEPERRGMNPAIGAYDCEHGHQRPLQKLLGFHRHLLIHQVIKTDIPRGEVSV
jgi:hypothetical protein